MGDHGQILQLTISNDVCLQYRNLRGSKDSQPILNERIYVCTLKAARQLNALSRISIYKYKSFFSTAVTFLVISIIAHSFGIFALEAITTTLKTTQERSLPILLLIMNQIFMTCYTGQTLAFRRLKYMLLEVNKCIRKFNTHSLYNLFISNTIPHQLRTLILEQPLDRSAR